MPEKLPRRYMLLAVIAAARLPVVGEARLNMLAYAVQTDIAETMPGLFDSHYDFTVRNGELFSEKVRRDLEELIVEGLVEIVESDDAAWSDIYRATPKGEGVLLGLSVASPRYRRFLARTAKLVSEWFGLDKETFKLRFLIEYPDAHPGLSMHYAAESWARLRLAG